MPTLCCRVSGFGASSCTGHVWSLLECARLYSLGAKTNSPLQVRAAEDMLSLTRIMKEQWLFGKLHTVGTSEAEKRAGAAAAKATEGLIRLQRKERDVATTKATSSNTEGAMDTSGVNEELPPGEHSSSSQTIQ